MTTEKTLSKFIEIWPDRIKRLAKNKRLVNVNWQEWSQDAKLNEQVVQIVGKCICWNVVPQKKWPIEIMREHFDYFDWENIASVFEDKMEDSPIKTE